MSGPARTLVVTMDAADPELVRGWAAAGELPNVARLLARGTAAPMVAPPGTFVTSNWASIATGLGPDQHRYLCWDEHDPVTYEHRETNPDPATILGTPFWQHLSDAGRRTAIVDLPHTWPAPIDGVMVVEWGCHDRHAGTRSWPEDLIGELDSVTGGHPIGQSSHPDREQFAPCDYRHREGALRTPDEEHRLFTELQGMVERKRQASLHLLDRGGWDVFWTVFAETHCVGHQLYHLHDPDHPRHDPDLRRRMGVDPMLDIYRRVDAAIGEHLDRLGPGDTAYLVLPHGMIAHHDGTHMLEPILTHLERSLDEPDHFGRATRLASLATSPLPAATRRRANRLAAPLVRRRLTKAPAGPPSPPMPMPERRWYLAPNNTVTGGIRLNLAGREGQGRIHPGARNEVLHWLIDRLGELINVDTGGPVVTDVIIADDVYERRPDDLMPDLFVEWDRTNAIERIWSPATGTIVVPYDEWRTGDHHTTGLVVAAGPGIRHAAKAPAIDSIDLPVTVSRSVGVTLPEVQGRAVAALLPEQAHPVDAVGPPRWADRTGPHPGLRRSLAKLERRAATAKAHGLDHWEAPTGPGATNRNTHADAQALDRLAHAHHQTRQELDRLRTEVQNQRSQIVDLGREAAIGRTMAWLRQQPPADDTLVSVVMPTRNRAAVLGGAIDSIRNQTHTRWELLVVDDGSTDETAELLASIDEPRMRVLTNDHRGVAAARNTGIDAATGDLICYLDDDNRFDPEWFKALAWAFAQSPDALVGYGARLVDDFGRHHGEAPSGDVWLQHLPWDRQGIGDFNRVDMNVLAHRPGPARFDPDLSFFADWDLVLSLTAQVDPIEISAIAACYSTALEDRLTTTVGKAEQQEEYDRIRAKHQIGASHP